MDALVSNQVVPFKALWLRYPQMKILASKSHNYYDVFKDPKRSGHKGFGFVTSAEAGVATWTSKPC